jgi:hypothetical protein
MYQFVSGVDNPDDTLLQITNTVRSAIKPDLSLFVDCKKEKISKATVIAVTVQRGTSCPYYLAGKGIRPEGVYVRQGASSVPASETAIFKMIKETDGEKYEEIRSLNQDLTFVEAGGKIPGTEKPRSPKQVVFSRKNHLLKIPHYFKTTLVKPDRVRTVPLSVALPLPA